MKKLLLLLFIVVQSTVAQQIYWEQVGLKVDSGKAKYVLNLIDSFYSEIEMPDGVSLALDAVWYHPEGYESTHYITFSGSLEGITELRKLRSGDKYDKYNAEIANFCSITTIQSGSTLARWNTNKGADPISQLWQFNVSDPATFLNEFMKMEKAFPQDGYLSIGLITQGASSDGENHYVYTTHKDYKSAISWGPKTQKAQSAFLSFQKNTGAYANYLGTVTLNRVKVWN